MRLSGLFGVLLLGGVLLADVAVSGDPFAFFYLPAFMVCTFGTIGLMYLSFGALDSLRALGAIRYLVLTPGPDVHLARSSRVLAGAVSCAYACGLAGTAISFFKMLLFAARQNQFIWGLSPTLISLLPVFYALILAEFLFRPASRRLADLAPEPPR